MLTGGAGNFSFSGSQFNLSGGNFTASSATTSFNGSNLTQTGGTFNHNGGTILCTGDSSSFDVPTTINFNNLIVNANNFSGISVPPGDTLNVAGNLELTDGVIGSIGFSTGTIEAQGDVTIASTFDGGGIALRFGGSANQTFANNGGANPGNPWTINKPSGTVTAATNLLLQPNQSLNITSGTLYLNENSNLTTGAINIGANGKLVNDSATTITLGGNITNSGLIDLQGGGAACPENDTIFIRSTDATQRSWNGTGRYRLVDVDVQHMGGTGTKTVFSGTNSNGNNASWIFNPNCPSTLSITPSSTGVQTGQTQTFTAGGGFAPYTFSILKNNSGGSIDPTSGLYTAGTTAGATDTVRVNDSFGTIADATVTIFGAPNKLAFTVQPSNTTAGQTITPAVRVAVQDQFGNTITNSNASVILSIQNNPTGGTLSGTLTKNAVNGVATFNNLSISRAGDGYALRAVSGSLTAATSGAFNITAGAANRLAFTVQPSNTDADAIITPAVQVIVQDALGNTITNANDAITIGIGNNPSGGTLSGTLTRNAAGGVAKFSDLKIDNAGNGYTLAASSGVLTSATSAAFNIVNPFVVTNTNDSGAGSLRQAIILANQKPGTQTISFDIAGTAPFTIAVNSMLPSVNNEIIDATTQPGFAGSPIVELTEANGATIFAGLTINSSTVKGLVVNSFTVGIEAVGGSCVIQGNYLGTNISGNAAAPQTMGSGLRILAANTIIGGANAAERNIISGNNTGIAVSNGANNVSIKGNFIGTNSSGSSAVPNGKGISTSNFVNSLVIGGSAAGEGNLIAFNTGSGISHANFNALITGNSIHSNGGIGIDLNYNNVTLNDPLDSDAGPNNLQNYPVLTSATTSGGNTTITGTLNSTPSKPFTLEFFSSPTCDASGFGEGETFLGATQISTDAGGIAGFTANLSVSVLLGHVITATATDGNGNSSEFSRCSSPVTAATFSISGRITDGAGNPVRGVVIIRQGTPRLSSVTDSNGNYIFKKLPAGGNYTLVPSKTNFTFTPTSLTFNNLQENKTNQNISAAQTNLVLNGQIKNLSDVGSFALSGVTINLTGNANRTTKSDLNGKYFFNNLSPGNYTITPTREGFTFTPPSANLTISTSVETANFYSQGAPSEGRLVFSISNRIYSVNAGGGGDLVHLFNGTQAELSPDGNFGVIDAESFGNSLRPRFTFVNLTNSEFSPFTALFTEPLIGPDFAKNATFSPDGTKIAFIYRDGLGKADIVNFAAQNRTLVTAAASRDPNWSPNGSKIVYVRFDSGTTAEQICSINTDGSGVTLLDTGDTQSTNQRFRQYGSPRYSPDNLRIAFVKSGDIYLMNADGTNKVLFRSHAPASSITSVAWSPDGTQLAFTESSGVFRINLDGSGLTTILEPAVNSISSSGVFWGRKNSLPTGNGSDVSVQTSSVKVTFDNVTANGTTSITPISPASAGNVPGGYVLGNQAYEITTNAVVSPPITVCFNVLTATTETQFNQLRIMHNENGTLVDRTILAPDSPAPNFATRTLCARTNSLSPFALAELVDPNLPRISGLVQDNNGNPLVGISVVLTGAEDRTMQTDSDGAFNFVNLTAGANYNVSPKQVGYLFTEYNQDFVNLTDEETVVFEGAASEFQISGQIIDGNGSGINGIIVELGGAVQATTQTDASGNYTFTNLPADGFYNLTPSNGVSSFTPPNTFIDPLTSNAGGIDFQTFAPTAASVQVGGRVAAAGGGVSDARVSLTDSSGETRTAITNSFGYYRFDDVAVGETYILNISHRRFQFTQPTQVIFVIDELSDVNFYVSP